MKIKDNTTSDGGTFRVTYTATLVFTGGSQNICNDAWLETHPQHYVVSGSEVSACIDACGAGDSDGDGVCNDVDNCLLTGNAGQADSDSDGVGDACDICPGYYDGGDSDGDGIPNGCDPQCVNTVYVNVDDGVVSCLGFNATQLGLDFSGTTMYSTSFAFTQAPVGKVFDVTFSTGTYVL